MPDVSISEEELTRLRAQAGEPESSNFSPEAQEAQRATAAEAIKLRAAVDAAIADEKSRAADPYEVTGWKKRLPYDIEMPSGQTCRAKDIALEDTISMGLLDSLDMFTSALMSPMLEDKQEEESQNARFLSTLKDPEKRAKFFGTLNQITVAAVLIPSVVGHDDGNLPDGIVFVGDIPFVDKLYIFKRVFASQGESVSSFHEGSSDGVAIMAAVSGVQQDAE